MTQQSTQHGQARIVAQVITASVAYVGVVIGLMYQAANAAGFLM